MLKKNLFLSIALATAALIPTMPANATACVHTGPPPEVHLPECEPILGGCSFASVTDAVAGDGQMTGEIDIEAVVYSVTDPTQNPVSATITCYIKVNGAAQPGAVVSAFGTVVVVGGGIITYTSTDVTDFVQLCQRVDYSGTVQDSDECFEATTIEIPPPLVWEIVDPILCQALVLLAGSYGPITIQGPDPRTGGIGGDVYIDGELVFDCPVYES